MGRISEIDPATAHKLASNGEAVIIDVREQNEVSQAAIDGAVLMPMSIFDPSLIPIETSKKIVFLCAHGIRSFQISQYLISQGILNNAYNISGGLAAWTQAGLPIKSDR